MRRRIGDKAPRASRRSARGATDPSRDQVRAHAEVGDGHEDRLDRERDRVDPKSSGASRREDDAEREAPEPQDHAAERAPRQAPPDAAGQALGGGVGPPSVTAAGGVRTRPRWTAPRRRASSSRARSASRLARRGGGRGSSSKRRVSCSTARANATVSPFSTDSAYGGRKYSRPPKPSKPTTRQLEAIASHGGRPKPSRTLKLRKMRLLRSSSAVSASLRRSIATAPTRRAPRGARAAAGPPSARPRASGACRRSACRPAAARVVDRGVDPEADPLDGRFGERVLQHLGAVGGDDDHAARSGLSTYGVAAAGRRPRANRA